MTLEGIDPIYVSEGFRFIPTVVGFIYGGFMGIIRGVEFDEQHGYKNDVIHLVYEENQEPARKLLKKSEKQSRRMAPLFTGGLVAAIGTFAGGSIEEILSSTFAAGIAGSGGFEIGKRVHTRYRRTNEITPKERRTLETLYDQAVAAYVTENRESISRTRIKALNFQYKLLAEKSGPSTLRFVETQVERLNAYESP
ncbi:hypothetical protein HOD38_03415 [archaeon]|jgi:hypothetical protein|nr:hypothetical protein [archaeon]MBT4397289.1 hypothetical protein [archaeon]MBT4440669.1 hypothetical protein [archaeon]